MTKLKLVVANDTPIKTAWSTGNPPKFNGLVWTGKIVKK